MKAGLTRCETFRTINSTIIYYHYFIWANAWIDPPDVYRCSSDVMLNFCSCRCSLTWKIHRSTTSSRLKGSTSGSTCPPPWGVKLPANAPASRLSMAWPLGPAAAPPAAPKLCSPSTPTARKRWVLVWLQSELQEAQISPAALISTDGRCDWWHHQLGVELQRGRPGAHGPGAPDEQHGKCVTCAPQSATYACVDWNV